MTGRIGPVQLDDKRREIVSAVREYRRRPVIDLSGGGDLVHPVFAEPAGLAKMIGFAQDSSIDRQEIRH